MRTPLTPHRIDQTPAPTQPPAPLTVWDYIRGWTIPTARDFGREGWGAGYIKLAVDAALIAGGVYLYRRYNRRR